MTVVVFTFVLMLASVLKEVLGLLVNRQASGIMVLQAIGLLIPYVMVFALPMGMLTAALLVFGRLSADNELTAVRASGLSLLSLVSPVLLLSLALSVLAAIINLEIAPRCRVVYKEMLYQVGMAKGASFIPEKTYIKDFPGVIVYVSEVHGTNLEDVLIYEMRRNRVEGYCRADEGSIQFDVTNRVITVVLYNATRVFFMEGHRLPQTQTAGTVEFPYTNVMVKAEKKRVDLDNMTFMQLRQELRSLEQGLQSVTPLNKMPVEQLRQRMKQLTTQRKDLATPIRVRMHRQVAFSFACVGFTLVGIPLGIRAHRRETTFGIAMALLLVILYYSFFILGLAFETRPHLAPHLILWLPNFIFQAVGAVLLWRANRGL